MTRLVSSPPAVGAPSAPELVGPREIATRLGIAGANVRQWQHRGILPEPFTVVSGTPMWEWPVIRAWVRSKRHLRALLRGRE